MAAQVHEASLLEAIHDVISNATLLRERGIFTERREVDYRNAEGRVGTYILRQWVRIIWQGGTDTDLGEGAISLPWQRPGRQVSEERE